MKITIQPTQDQSEKEPDSQQPTISIEVPGDDMNINEFFNNLIIPALKASGYNQDTINAYLDQ